MVLDDGRQDRGDILLRLIEFAIHRVDLRSQAPLGESQLLTEEMADVLRAYAIADLTAQPTPYDCLYPALAERAGCAYWTDDARFVRGTQPRFPHVRQLGT